MKFHITLALFLFPLVFTYAQANQGRVQGLGDGETAQKYVEWVQKAIDEGNWSSALSATARASDFANVSSDVSYQRAFVLSHEGKSRIDIVSALDRALDVNRWVIYNESQALLLKARELIAMRKFVSALAVLEQTGESADTSAVSDTADIASNIAVLRLLALRGMASSDGQDYDPVLALSRFRSQILTAMDRYSRDPRPLRVFFEYARNKRPELSELAQSDHDLLEIALKRFPFLLSADSDLAWLSSYFISDTEQAKRYVGAYRAGGISSVQNRDFMPNPHSIPPALNLGLLDDTSAVEELFSGKRGINYVLPPGTAFNNEPVLDAGVMNEVFSLLRSDEGRDFFMEKLLSFSGTVISDDDGDGYIDGKSLYQSGVVREFAFDINQGNIFNLRISFSSGGVPVAAQIPVTGHIMAEVQWERYPSVRQITLDDMLNSNLALSHERFLFRPADFQYMPVDLLIFGGSKKYAGPAYPALMPRYLGLTRKALVSFCSSIQRSSLEFEGATEEIFLEKGIPLRAVETINGKQVSVTEFEKGVPVLQRVDMDIDGKMETIRRFYRADSSWIDLDGTFNYRRLIASSESDWTGQGTFKTGEMYRKDGSVVYSWDMDGSGEMNYSETGR
ncbi:MAG: hypothetical protein LBV17_06070 [Treponema sp.]|jgi:hypothetical protein|nr:hypothetical protein [Treponema sp.]